MSKRVLKIIILLTALVGFKLPALAQVEPVDSIPATDSLLIPADSALQPIQPDSLSGVNDSAKYRIDPLTGKKIRLSTDSVYATPLGNSNDLLPSMVEYTATDSIVGSLSLGKAHLYRDAYVKYKELTIKAGYISIDFNTSEVFASGIKDTSGAIIQKPIFTESGKSYRADTMRYNFKTKKAKIKKVITQEGEGFLHGQNVKKVTDNVFYVKNAAYTTCSHEDPHFRIKTPKAKVITGDKIVTKFAYLELLEIPTPLMVPFGFFPTTETRKSGIIIPTYGKNQYRGFFLTNGGYYWAASEYFDLTLTGDIYTQGGYGLKASSTYVKRYKFSGNLSASYNRIRFGREEFAEYANEFFDDRSDFAITWGHNQNAKSRPDFRFNANVNIASSNYYKVTSIKTEDVLQNRLNSSISINKSWVGRPYNLTASINHSQNNQTNDMTVTLPNVNFSVNRVYPFKQKTRVGPGAWYEQINFSYNLAGRNEIKTKLNKPFFTETVFTDSANTRVDHSIPITATYKFLKYINFTPNFTYNERWVFERYEWQAGNFPTSDTTSIYGVRAVDTASGLYSIRDYSMSAGLSTVLYGLWRYNGFLKALRHQATPGVSFSYTPDFSTDFWGYYQELPSDTLGSLKKYNRYQGLVSPSQRESGRLNFSLQNTLEAKIRSKEDSTGVKKIRLLEGLSLNTGYDLFAEEFKWSDVGISARSSIFNGLISLTYNASLDLYGYDEGLDSNGRVIGRVNKFAVEVNNKLARFNNQRFSLGLNLSPERFKRNKQGKPNSTDDADKSRGLIDGLDSPSPNALGITEGDIDYYRARGFVDFKLPWSLSMNYNLSKTYSGTESNVTQSADISGDFEVTQNWRVGFSTGYDLVAKDFTYTSFDFYRNLHCWELRCSWVPMGFQQSYMLTIRVKANTLKDLKLSRQRGIGDFER